jgi:hypothetical protein
MEINEKKVKKTKAEASAENGKLGGRPLEYTPEHLIEKAQEYFDFLDKKENWLDK